MHRLAEEVDWKLLICLEISWCGRKCAGYDAECGREVVLVGKSVMAKSALDMIVVGFVGVRDGRKYTG